MRTNMVMSSKEVEVVAADLVRIFFVPNACYG